MQKKKVWDVTSEFHDSQVVLSFYFICDEDFRCLVSDSAASWARIWDGVLTPPAVGLVYFLLQSVVTVVVFCVNTMVESIVWQLFTAVTPLFCTV